MRIAALAVALAFVAGAAALWLTGGFAEIAAWARGEQRELQNALARAMRAARTGEASAVWALISASALYGLVHAVGPGHGKFLIGGAAVASRRTAWRMALIGVAASLGQAVTAIVLVYGGMALVGITARWAERTAEDWLAPASYIAIGLIGLWLVWRGVRAFLRRRVALGHEHHHAHDHGHAHDHLHDQSHSGECGCGHKHGATAEEVEAIRSWRDVAALIGGIAIRPCTGAVIVLVIAWRFDIALLGAAAATAMALGTGVVVGGTALAATWFRDSSYAAAGSGQAASILAPTLQCLAGGAIVLFSGTLLFA